MNIKNSVLDYIRNEQLNWYGQVQRLDEERLPRRVLKWCPPGRIRRKVKISKFMCSGREGNWKGMDQKGRVEKENNTLGTERCENIYTVHK